ncbi:hypothetical protein GT646_07445 [Clostridium butyricum]|uniref:DUF5651 domain-containing protein n=1 Tax=Clostridium butyricum TaxID=1492 RepID=UPI0012B03DA5|nr:DUF5651 domain-containing protein [Clostridium butyricum]MSA63215.1 hypothetical protein [Gordonibacter pamelaeae]MZI80677.1 hypothetical protein [Clostridium butyricum]
MLKDYLNNSETKEMIILSQARNLIKHFVDGNVMAKDEKTDLKKASTFIKKSLVSLNKRLGEAQAKKFVRLNENTRVVAITNSELEVLQKRKSAELDAAFEDSKEYFDLVEITMDLNCKNCTKCFKDCDLYKHFEEQEVIPFNEEIDLGNCKYAYRSDDVDKKH